MLNNFLIFFLSILRVVSRVIISKFKNFFCFIFILVYIGAILVLIIYISSSNISSKQIIQKGYILIGIFLFIGIFSLGFFFTKKNFESELKDFFYKKKELFFVLFLCIAILLVLFCLLKLDFFRFSSLRTKV